MNDLVLRGGLVADGTGAPAYPADVAVRDGRIVHIGPGAGPARRELDAGGLTVAPGFMDIHAHADLFMLNRPGSDHRILQGVTAEIAGNCGFSAAPLGQAAGDYRDYARPVLGLWPKDAAFTDMAGYLHALEQVPLRHNIGTLVGCGALRTAVRGYRPGTMTAGEMDRFLVLLHSSLDAGTLGVSLGLMYVPEAYFTTDELIAIASAAAEYRRPMTVHLRGEGALLLPCIDEMIEVARRSGASVHISHLKAAGRDSWGGALSAAIGKLEAARAQGLDLTADAYPYAAGSTTILSLLPPWALSEGAAALSARLREDPVFYGRVADAVRQRSRDWDNLVVSTGWERVTVAGTPGGPEAALVGRTIAECAAEAAMDPADFALQLTGRTGGDVSIVFHHMDPADVDRAVAWPHSCVVSDSIYSETGCPHPRMYGTYGRLLGEFVRDRGVLSLEKAVQKCTSMPADRMNLKGRGRIAEGAFADLTVFDTGEIADRADYLSPRRYPAGIRGVVVNGGVALWDGQTEPGCFGQVLRASRQEG